LGDGPFIFDTAEQHKIKVTVITKNLDRPFGMVFLPGGNILVSERGPGRLRIIRDGVLDPQPIGGVPKVNSRANAGLYDFVLHPKYAQNQWIYFAFSKPGEGNQSATVLARGKLQGSSLLQVQELYSTEHGPNGGDEVNLIKPGANYGWPVISFGRQYDGTRITPYKEGMEIPQIVWVPSIGPSGIMFYTGDKFPAWKNNLFVGSARYGEI